MSMFAEVIEQGIDVGAPYGFAANCSCGGSPHDYYHYMFDTPYIQAFG